ncbi:3-deoxy-manno-octulosonate cytidylyltransferase [Poriferisphaera corsica]|uniref:3-deoxy-manno-octulosonate cytidylyltransferase n=1 Tax=Poriferisphaera corsica TaxID=2528020 RepID=A0A517YQA3_9BACT|nr:3-deoxy-manno-octulosonate cytidylyltransferase [Poriferisphaera corsica]QDU32405.1 3-deoxy-manno-octulosonate cytidylyltransferase [Poriferisphaera corsica]
MSARAIAIIPARYDSTRFPGKPLANKTGKPLIQHVIEQVRRTKRVVRIIVATDDQRIFDAVTDCGSEAMMTRKDHPNGTSRIAEVVEKLKAEYHSKSEIMPQIIVNVQGDEPEVEPDVIDTLINGLHDDTNAPMATLASDFAPNEDPSNPNIVKLITNLKGHAIYFSRSLIPHNRDGDTPLKPLKHPGLYAYRPDFLNTYINLEPTPLENAEKLEQLRPLEHGYPIAIIKANVQHHGIDTPEQYEAFVNRFNSQ